MLKYSREAKTPHNCTFELSGNLEKGSRVEEGKTLDNFTELQNH